MSNMSAKISKSTIFLIVFLVIIIIITIFSALNPDFGEIFSINNWFNKDALNRVEFWIAVLFVMLVCFLGALIPVPIPYAIPITLFAGAWYSIHGVFAWPFILIMVAFGALANTFGDLIDYLIGRGAEYVLSKDDPGLQDRWSKIILKKPKAIPAVIVIFGLTPLPDSLLMVPLGIVDYSMKKTILWMYVGRFGMFFLFGLAGIYALEGIITLLSGESGEYGWISGVVLLYLIWLIIFLMVKYKPKDNN
ncbi:MAG: hypothetical protein ACP6IY_11485 [Promethearchaeia archaeon]